MHAHVQRECLDNKHSLGNICHIHPIQKAKTLLSRGRVGWYQYIRHNFRTHGVGKLGEDMGNYI